MPKPKKHGVQPTPAHSLTKLKLQHLTGVWNNHRRHHDLTHQSGWDEPANERKGHHKIKVCLYIFGAKDVHIENFHIHKRKLLISKVVPTNGLI